MNQTLASDQLRNHLVDAILHTMPLSSVVERALRTVPREAFLPGIDLPEAYADQAVSTKDNPLGGDLPLSYAFVPSVVATMLNQLDVRAGDDTLEIGTGTGYNSALLAELTGHHGHVTTIDIDSDVALHARTMLDHAGYQHVHVMERDGLRGTAGHPSNSRPS
ncbi:methyltransferase domain-containing protein [Streptomyces adustus]